MRAPDVVEKVSRERPRWLHPYRRFILDRVADIPQQQVRWPVAQIVPRLGLDREDVPGVRVMLQAFLSDDSRIVRVEAMQALTFLVCRSPDLRPEVRRLIEDQGSSAGAAVRSRRRKLLAVLSSSSG